MKVLILGAKGMLGKALVTEFSLGYEVIAWDKEDLDITNSNETRFKIGEVKPDLVINAIAYNAVDAIEQNSHDFELAMEINGRAVGSLAKICKEFNVPLVHYSSDYVFNGENHSGYREDSFISPISKYGVSKALGENLLKAEIDQYYLIRLSRLFGPMGDSAMAKKSFVDLMIDLVVNKNKQEIDLVDEEKSCSTYSIDLAKFTRALWEKKEPFGIYHGANSSACTWYEFGQEIFKIKNLDVKVNPVSSSAFPRPAKRPSFSELINTKLPKQRSWQEALREYLVKS